MNVVQISGTSPNRLALETRDRQLKMSFAGTIRARPLVFLFGLAAVSLLGLLLVPPVPQSQIYHGFADHQTIYGIPNFWNVASNLPFMLVGALGLLNVNVRHELSASLF